MAGDTFFTADTHFGHGNIIKYCNRPFLADADKQELERQGGVWHRGDWKGPGSSNWRISQEAIDEMDTILIDNINKTVGEKDFLWHLGDFAFAPRQYYVKTCQRYRDRIKCKNVFMLMGNHDKDDIDRVFPFVYTMHEIHPREVRIVLCHYAMALWNKSHRGSWHLYGHSHGNFEKWADANMPYRRAMDVGVDNAATILGEYRPFSYDEIAKIMSRKTGFHADHHISENVPTEEELLSK